MFSAERPGQRYLELLAPAKDKETGIAAINCGADAVYIAGPSFGARAGAGNSIEDIAELCSYAHRFGVRIYLTLNTIIYENELEEARCLVEQAADAGVDAIIVQDLSLLKMDIPPIPLHASTQTRIRNVEDALLMQKLGFERIILERNLSLEQIKDICNAVDIEVEAFVHGAICVSYSGNCYLSCALTGRSANRGECIQACRNYYNLIDDKGNVLVRNKPLLSLKDYRLDSLVPQMARSGICSFKIEGRLKNISYVKNTVSHYNEALNGFIAENPGYCRASVLSLIPRNNSKSSTDALTATFNRGFTELFIHGRRGSWLSGNSAKFIGQHIGYATGSLAADRFLFSPLSPDISIFNGDGLYMEFPDGSGIGMRANSVNGNTISCRFAEGSTQMNLLGKLNKPSLYRKNKEERIKLFRSYNISLERELENSGKKREIPVELKVNGSIISVIYSGDKQLEHTIDFPFTKAENPQRATDALAAGLGKSAGDFSFRVSSIEGEISFYPQSVINQARRDIAQKLASYFKERYELARKESFENFRERRALLKAETAGNVICDYRANIANHLAREVYQDLGCKDVGDAFELSCMNGNALNDAELMRCKYCLRYELGACLKGHNSPASIKPQTKLYLENEGRMFALDFDCRNCEMVIRKHTGKQS